MPRASALAATTLAVVVPLLALGPTDAAAPPANLVATHVTGSMSAGKVVASATVKNRGDRTARRSHTTFLLSRDGTVSADDKALGRVKTGKVRARRSRPVSGAFAIPASVADGAYRVIACVDSGHKVGERREDDNCTASGMFAVVKHVRISWAIASDLPDVQGPTVTASATGGSCTAAGTTGSCTVSTGASTVTLTASGDVPLVVFFDRWQSSGSCGGVTSGTRNEILTISNPTADQSCVAVYHFAV